MRSVPELERDAVCDSNADALIHTIAESHGHALLDPESSSLAFAIANWVCHAIHQRNRFAHRHGVALRESHTKPDSITVRELVAVTERICVDFSFAEHVGVHERISEPSRHCLIVGITVSVTDTDPKHDWVSHPARCRRLRRQCRS